MPASLSFKQLMFHGSLRPVKGCKDCQICQACSNVVVSIFLTIVDKRYKLTPQLLQRAHAERDSVLAECIELLFKIASRPYYLKLLYGARYMLHGFLTYKNPKCSHPKPAPTFTAEQAERILATNQAIGSVNI